MKHRLVFTTLFCGYAFLYLPIALLIIGSFNQSPVTNAWGGFSTEWYQALWENHELLSAVLVSFHIATLSATLAVVLGTLGAVVLVRFGPFKGRTLFEGMTTAPLIMPDVLTGLAMLMMFVTFEQMLNWPAQRGLTTVTIAHTTMGFAYVCLVVQARLRDFDKRLEEAALDLGARPTKVFLTITLPLISPSLIAGWLLAFSLSLDDIVIASFLSGPGATTLPMLIFSSVRVGVSPEINALATIIIGIVSVGVVIAGILMHRRNRK